MLRFISILLCAFSINLCLGNSKIENTVKDTLSFFSKNILFDTDKHNIRKDYIPVLNDLINKLVSINIIGIELYGHTDSRASEDYNLALSKKRASGVKKYLIDHKVEDSIVTYKAYGESAPAEENIKISFGIRFKSNLIFSCSNWKYSRKYT